MNKHSTLNGLLHLRQLHQRITHAEADLAKMQHEQHVLQLGVYATCDHNFVAVKGYEHEGTNCVICGVSNWMLQAHVAAWETLKEINPESYKAVCELLEPELSALRT